MAQYRKIPVVVEAHQWHKNGDHPDDYKNEIVECDGPGVWSGEFQREQNWEGQVVRYFRHPNRRGLCPECGESYHIHGWIDTKEGGHRVCPGDFIITGVKGERYPCKPDIFAATYEAV